MTNDEKTRYFRQILLEDFGEEAQDKLKAATVLVSGVGGLGSPAALYLAAAGVGRLIICDRDVVELSNLNRQILHNTYDIGLPKAASAGDKLSMLNPDIKVETHQIHLDKESLESIAADADVLVDCLDNLETRLALNGFSILHSIPVVHAGIDSWSGQVTFLNPPDTPCMNCLFGSVKDSADPKPVLGAVVGVIGAIQALEVIRFLTGIGKTLKNRLLFFDGREMEWSSIEIRKDKDCNICSSL